MCPPINLQNVRILSFNINKAECGLEPSSFFAPKSGYLFHSAMVKFHSLKKYFCKFLAFNDQPEMLHCPTTICITVHLVKLFAFRRHHLKLGMLLLMIKQPFLQAVTLKMPSFRHKYGSSNKPYFFLQGTKNGGRIELATILVFYNYTLVSIPIYTFTPTHSLYLSCVNYVHFCPIRQVSLNITNKIAKTSKLDCLKYTMTNGVNCVEEMPVNMDYRQCSDCCEMGLFKAAAINAGLVKPTYVNDDLRPPVTNTSRHLISSFFPRGSIVRKTLEDLFGSLVQNVPVIPIGQICSTRPLLSFLKPRECKESLLLQSRVNILFQSSTHFPLKNMALDALQHHLVVEVHGKRFVLKANGNRALSTYLPASLLSLNFSLYFAQIYSDGKASTLAHLMLNYFMHKKIIQQVTKKISLFANVKIITTGINRSSLMLKLFWCIIRLFVTCIELC
ncbi:hypothetical protein EGR_05409 [Echinococcus granulosus]|uniref:Uncharacterized protein n=1 Tax=Echinococcus granulosus TaxID=6210 RepID=W6V1N4_ECHGR|nr:hypothetical protein EGR_05409 [Echinococcus granulosus]EUB59789.1 hypothetical protein EGR_05409 [Echinococcus granulosus]